MQHKAEEVDAKYSPGLKLATVRKSQTSTALCGRTVVNLEGKSGGPMAPFNVSDHPISIYSMRLPKHTLG